MSISVYMDLQRNEHRKPYSDFFLVKTLYDSYIIGTVIWRVRYVDDVIVIITHARQTYNILH